jgi:hypothetical protein
MSEKRIKWISLANAVFWALMLVQIPLLWNVALPEPGPDHGAGDTKLYWPPSRLRDAAQAAGDILSMPARWVYDSCPGLPDAAVPLLFVLNSCLWGFALAIGLRFLFNRLHVSHDAHPA